MAFVSITPGIGNTAVLSSMQWTEVFSPIFLGSDVHYYTPQKEGPPLGLVISEAALQRADAAERHSICKHLSFTWMSLKNIGDFKKRNDIIYIKILTLSYDKKRGHGEVERLIQHRINSHIEP
jgi:hypothetical protein